MDNDVAKYKDLFITTAKDYCTQIIQALSTLSTNPQATQAIDAVHLSSHSLKSQNAAMGFSSSAEMFMTIEKIFAKIQEQSAHISSELLTEIKNCIDDFSYSLAQIQHNNQEQDMSAHTEKLQTFNR